MQADRAFLATGLERKVAFEHLIWSRLGPTPAAEAFISTARTRSKLSP